MKTLVVIVYLRRCCAWHKLKDSLSRRIMFECAKFGIFLTDIQISGNFDSYCCALHSRELAGRSTSSECLAASVGVTEGGKAATLGD